MKNLIAQGAEARIFSDGKIVIKERFSKGYRHPLIDNDLRKARTRREAKVLEKIRLIGVNSPELFDTDDSLMTLNMAHINGDKLRDILYKNPVELGNEIGRSIGLMHSNDIIHGDLTTSNMILDEKNKVNFIDFGLSFFSSKIEDKAVDLHLLRQALESKHYGVWEDAFKAVLEGYKLSFKDSQAVFSRLERVEQRGRNKH